ncbi:unnamed protein product [Paramecium pentaurelia]|uniref:Uncharacterized protein n=1 Tax=Paramecium pentaurelia TaxID=43138 RepID=A0A8S1WN66_9CILI|nr:unnamed protein product [Paramecium pentaurelia]
MIRDDLIISDLICKFVKTNSHQKNEPDMEETKDGGNTNSSDPEEEVSENQSSIIHDSWESASFSSSIQFTDYYTIEDENNLISSSQNSDSSSSSSSSSSSQTSESEDDEERKENLSVSNSE